MNWKENRMEDVIILYSTGCPKCKVLTKKLDMADIEYTVCNDIDMMIKMGFELLPMLKIGDKVMDFKNAVEWINKK